MPIPPASSIGLVHFRQNEVFKSLTVLVDPRDYFDPINISIHGIRPEDVVGKPTMPEVLPVISGVLEDTAIVHHSAFDRAALARAAQKYAPRGLPCVWVDTLRVARRSWEHFREDGGYGLANLARAFNIAFRHHDAAEDARAAGLVMLEAIHDRGMSLQQWVDEIGYQSTSEIAVPQRINPRLGRGSGLLATETQMDRFWGETIVFTGALQIARSEAALAAAEAGCAVADSVTKKTTILVVSDQDLRLTKGQEKKLETPKVRKPYRGRRSNPDHWRKRLYADDRPLIVPAHQCAPSGSIGVRSLLFGHLDSEPARQHGRPRLLHYSALRLDRIRSIEDRISPDQTTMRYFPYGVISSRTSNSEPRLRSDVYRRGRDREIPASRIRFL